MYFSLNTITESFKTVKRERHITLLIRNNLYCTSTCKKKRCAVSVNGFKAAGALYADGELPEGMLSIVTSAEKFFMRKAIVFPPNPSEGFPISPTLA